MTGPFWKLLPDGIDVSVRATPKAGRDSVDGAKTDAAGERAKEDIKSAATEEAQPQDPAAGLQIYRAEAGGAG